MGIDDSGEESISGTGCVHHFTRQGGEEPFFGGIAAVNAFAAQRDIDMCDADIEQAAVPLRRRLRCL